MAPDPPPMVPDFTQTLHDVQVRVHGFALDQGAAPAPGPRGTREGGDEHHLGKMAQKHAGNEWNMVKHVPDMLEDGGTNVEKNRCKQDENNGNYSLPSKPNYSYWK